MITEVDRMPARNYPQLTPYHQRVLTSLEPLRKALGYLPRHEVIPDQQNISVRANSIWNHRVTVPPGSFLYAVSGSSGQAEGFRVQIADFGTQTTLFTSLINWANITGQGSLSVPDCAGTAHTIATPLHYLNTPRPIIEPGVLNVQITNLSANANAIELVLWILTPPPPGSPRNQFNQELEDTVNLWRRAHKGKLLQLGSQLLPAYTQPFNVASIGDNVVVAGVPGYCIAIYQMSMWNTQTNTIRFLDGVNGTDITGPLIGFDGGDGYFLPLQTEPYFVLSVSSAFVLNLSAAQNVTGFVKYRIVDPWAPGGVS